MTTKVYKSATGWIVGDETVTPGQYRLNPNGDESQAEIKGADNEYRLAEMQLIGDYLKDDGAGGFTPYTDYADLKAATVLLFSGPSATLLDNEGNNINVQNPLPTDGDSVYCKDLDLVNSSIGNFSGEVCDLFNNYQKSNIAASVGGGGANPKSFLLVLKRPVQSSTVGIGSPDTSISNAKLTLIGLSGSPIKIIDNSADNTKKSIEVFQFEQKIFIAAQIEFYTDDEVSIGGAGITKSVSVSIDAINGVISNDNSTKSLLLASAIFTGVPIDTKNYGIIICSVYSDVASAVDGLIIEFSTDMVNWLWNDTYTIDPAKGKTFSVQTQARFMRVRYINGLTDQTMFQIETTLKPVYIKPSSHRIADTISGQDDAELVKAVLSGLDQLGIFRNIRATEVGNLMTADFLVEVGRGNIPGYSFIRKFGRVDSVQAAIPADIWEYGTTSGAEKYTFSTTNDIDTISSSNAGDTQDVIIEGLDVNGNELIQTATLNGQNKVPITPIWRFNRAYNDDAVVFLGDVYVYVDGVISTGVPNVVTTVRGYIKAGKGQTNQSMYTIPNGKKGFMFGEEVSLTKAGGATVVSADFEAQTREFGKVFRNKEFFTLISSGDSSKNYNFPVPLAGVGKGDFLPSVDVSANGVGASWAYTMLLIDD